MMNRLRKQSDWTRGCCISPYRLAALATSPVNGGSYYAVIS